VPLSRDPVSVLFDDGARALLQRAYTHPGRWQETRVADPTARHLAVFAAHGINLLGRDKPSAHGAGLNAHTRWMRGFVRALYHQHQYWSGDGGGWRSEPRLVPRRDLAIQVQIGHAMPVRGIIPAGRHVQIRTRPGGDKALAAVRRMPLARRIFAADGSHAGRGEQDLARRDWSGDE
jgi:hypothetical protein